MEVQIFGDGAGGVLALGERDCSVQRRNQKVLEETPAPSPAGWARAALLAAATRLGAGRALSLGGDGRVHRRRRARRGGAFYFLEVNTRIQVEHGVTEEVTGVDLVEWMVRLAAGELPPLGELAATARGAAIEARLYAEDPQKQFQPSCGLLTEVVFPDGVRVEPAVERGQEVTPYYDPMLAKMIARGATREEAAPAAASTRSSAAGSRGSRPTATT